MNDMNNNYKTKRIFILTVLFSLFVNYYSFAQSNFLQGYSSTISGKNFSYHSPLPDVNSCLLTRASDDYDPIEWATQIVPSNYNNETVSFIWMYAIDVVGESENFDFYVNDKKYFSFSNPVDLSTESWTIKNNGAELTFNRTMIDKYKDEMGFAILKIPTNAIKLGESVKLKIDGADKKSTAWYMTFKTSIKEEITIYQHKTVSRKGNDLYHTARINFIHLGEPTKTDIYIGDNHQQTVLKSGYNSVDMLLPKVDEPTELIAKIKIGNKKVEEFKFQLEPIKEWTVYLVQHSHTDIGYTRPQTEILAEHLRYIDDALDYCDQTDDYPDNAKFRWTCEASWAVREYFKSRPKSQIDRLLERIKEGRIEVTGMFFNFCDIVDETALAIQTKTIKDFKERGIDVTTAMQNDVNGIGWCMVDFFNSTDVKYLTMGQHGHRAHVPFDKPTSFWWESPSGNRLLAYRSEHYMHGNALALTSGYLDVFSSNLSKYLDDLDGKGYPFDRTSIQFSGYVTDNSPPSTIACDIVKEWNEKYEWPKLKLALANEFMNFIEENKSDYIPTKKVAWPDWWTDGFGSAMNETKAARSTHSEMIANMGLLSMSKMLGAELPNDINDEISDVFDNLLFYDEHTYGAAESISDPLAENSVIQWGEKAAYAWTAVKESSLLREKAMGFMQQFISKSNVPTIAIFNTLNWKRSGLVTVYIDHEILPQGKKFQILDKEGNSVPAQIMNSRSDGTYWALWVKDVPSFGYKTLSINVSDESASNAANQTNKKDLQNKYYNIEIDSEKGVITKIFDKELNANLVDENSEIKLGEFIYEQLENRHSMERLTNANRDTVYVPLKKELSNLSNISVGKIEEGEIWSSIKLNGHIPICADERGVNIEIRLYNVDKRIEILYGMHKLPVTSPEAVYVAFPFKLGKENNLAFEVQGGVVYPGINQLEGTASDWNTVQNFAAVKSDVGQIVYSSNDIPLVQFGDINSGRFYYKHEPEKSHIYSWVLNNYWTTNYKASQEGEMTWKYNITSSNDNSETFAYNFGWGTRVPLLSRVMPAGNTKNENVSNSILNINVPNLLLVNAKPALSGEGVILQLRETKGDHAILDINKLKYDTGAKEINEVTILEEKIKQLDAPLLIEHYETKFIQINK